MAADRPAGPQHVGRSAVWAPEAMVATSQPLAAQAGLDLMRRGGNAVDAAICTAAVLCVTEPMSTGLGGDAFAIGYDQATGTLYGLNGSGRAPAAATAAALRERGATRVPLRGMDAVTVPGAADAWGELSKRYGRLPLAEVLAAAVHYARDGFPVGPITAAGWRSLEPVIRDDPEAAAVFLPAGRAPAAGERFANPELARTLEIVASDGPRAMYEGDLAQALVAESRRRGGLLTEADLSNHRSTWVEPLRITFRGLEVAELPPNGQGIVALEMLRLLEGCDLEGLGFGPSEDRTAVGLPANALHHLMEVTRIAFADREAYLSDPDSGAPVAELLADAYLDRRRRQIDPRRAGEWAAGSPLGGDTVYLTAVDPERNAVSFIQSLFHGFGSGVGVRGTGLVLQNRGAGFTLEEGHPNMLRGGRRPRHTIIPAMALLGGRPYLSFGVMGGDMQPQGHTQVLLHHWLGGLDVQSAGEVPRVQYRPETGDFALESGIPDSVRRELVARGHRLTDIGRGGFGGYQAIRIDPETGYLSGGSEPRKDGQAVGY